MRDIDGILRGLKPLVGSDLSKALWFLNTLSSDPNEYRENESLIRLLGEKHSKLSYGRDIRLPPKGRLQGELRLGSAIYPESQFSSVGIDQNELVRHVLICGMTGSGKTHLAYQLLIELTKRKIPFLVFDWKNSYRKLRGQRGLEDMRVISLGTKNCFSHNPLIPPPGVLRAHWIGMIVDVIKHSFFVAYGPEYFLRRGIGSLFNSWNVEETGIYPTFHDLEKVFRKEFVRGRELLWMNSVKRCLSILNTGPLSEIVNVNNQTDIESILNNPMVIELENLSIVERVFFVECLLLWIYHFRKLQGSSTAVRHVTVIEEGHHILSGRKEYEAGGESIMETSIRMIREFGEGIVVLDQEPSKLSKSILANSGTKISFALGRGEDIGVMAGCLGLDKDESRWLGQLRVGESILKIQDRIMEPIMMKVPFVSLEKQTQKTTTEEDKKIAPSGYGTPEGKTL